MPLRYGPLAVILLLVLISSSPAFAQEQRFELGGGAGFTWPHDPELPLDRGWDLGGFFGIRFNDNFGIETDFSFSRSSQQFFDESLVAPPAQEGAGWVYQPFRPATAFSDFDLQSTRYHLDAVLIVHLGRRQPFHPFFLAGAGVLREDVIIRDLTPLRGVNADEVDSVELESVRETEYYPVLAVGGGFDFYIFYNVAARFEYRLWTTQEWDRRTQRLFFTANYLF
jgi:opacity protein-like surface antigen